ncbi:MAG: hypothetical protein A4E45_00570 [Methanosaeta sp. PtaB.Bin039]|nr:MAG: hypothetical protein A4E45_00570 [Methanosaeta sp. PtaB.Bin039]
MKISLAEDQIAFILGETGTLAVSRTLGRSFFLETEEEEVVLFTGEDDLLVASSFGKGEAAERGLRCTIFQIRELEAPLIVLPKGHPASARLKTVISIGPLTRLSCRISPGTHPEQDVLCGSEEMDGIVVRACPGGADIEGFSGQVRVEKL